MSNLKERQADAEFNIRVPLCRKCNNHFLIKFNPHNPLKELIQCKVYKGDIPKDLSDCKSNECQYFDLNTESAKIYDKLNKAPS